MSRTYAATAHVPLELAKQVSVAYRTHKRVDEADDIMKDVQDAQSRKPRSYNGGEETRTVWINFPPDLSEKLALDLVDIFRSCRSKDMRALHTEFTRIAAMQAVDNPQVPALDKLPLAITNYLNKTCTRRGWLYKYEPGDDGEMVLSAYLPLSTEFHVGHRDDRPYVELECKYNGVGTESRGDRPSFNEKTTKFTWSGSEVVHRTVNEALRVHNLYAETEELEKDYEAELARFQTIREQFNEQFKVVGLIRVVGEYWYSRENHLSTKQKPAFVVNDESIVEHRPTEVAHSGIYYKRPSHKKGAGNGIMFVPYHPYIYGFDMGIHKSVWTRVSEMEEYKYTDISDKLVLPSDYKELVDALVHDLGFVGQSDIVADKGSGTPVLAIGKPGLGKTLLAEAVSHRLKRPLYKINAGYLLGGESNRVANVEGTLQRMLTRCERQKLLPLVDEADVMIAQRRADNLTQAAIVAAFLRTLEYFNGLLFLTSNRDSIDDAVLSRMAAVIRFPQPDIKGRENIWKIQAQAQGATLSAATIKELSKLECSGRDINRLLSLALRYHRSNGAKLEPALFKRIALFRGIELGGN